MEKYSHHNSIFHPGKIRNIEEKRSIEEGFLSFFYFYYLELDISRCGARIVRTYQKIL